MAFVDYYETLGVAAGDPVSSIKRAYRKLARKYHPDVSEEPDAEQRFKAIGEAWSVLKDAERRAEYDALRAHIASGGNGAGAGRQRAHWSGDGAPGPEPFAGGFSEADASDFFREIFGARAAAGGRSGHAGPRRGEDAHVALSIGLQSAHDGATLPLSLSIPVYRSDGTVELSRKTLRVTIPPGTLDGRRLRLAGQGGAGTDGAASGDLYIEIAVEPDDRFTVEGRDVHGVVDVLPWQAALGASVDVATLGGSVRVSVPAGSSGGKRLRLKGRGTGAPNSGDHYVTLRVRVPAPSSDAERAAWAALRDACEHGADIAGQEAS